MQKPSSAAVAAALRLAIACAARSRLRPVALLAAMACSSSALIAQRSEPWRVPCPFDTTKALLRVTCGRLRVPEDPQNPARTVAIAFMRVTATRNIDQNGPIVFLNGGPGENSLYNAEQLVTLPEIRDIVVDRDWIFFDQRGTGRSTPSLYCEPDPDWFTQVKRCRDRLLAQGVDLSQYNSARIAADMEALRAALGVRHWNVWGISYGARLAVVSARQYPASVRSIILDAAAMPESPELLGDALGTEAALHKLFTKCAVDAACASAYPQLRSRFMAALPRLRAQPLKAGDRTYDDAAVLGYVRGWLYPRGYSTYAARIQSLLAFMDAAARGDGQAVNDVRLRMRKEEETGAMPEPQPPDYGRFSVGQNLSVYCNEKQPFESIEDIQRAAATSDIVRALTQGVGGPNACSLWPSGQASAAVRTGVYDGPQLIYSGELDASSSSITGFEIAMHNPHARNVVFRNGYHGQLRHGPVEDELKDYRACALRLARAFVSDPQARLDTSCSETRRLRLVR